MKFEDVVRSSRLRMEMRIREKASRECFNCLQLRHSGEEAL